MEKWPGLFLFLFTAVYTFGAVCAASRRTFFIDEIITSCLADLPDIRQIWPLIAKGIELNPPLPFWIAWVIHHTIGGGEITSRIPAIFGFWLMCLCLYYFVRRRCGGIYGFVAFLLPMFTYPAWDSAVARGYGLMLGMSALALLSWQLASDRIRRRLALGGLAAGLAGAISCHYYAVYVAGAIGFGEIIRIRERRKADPAVWFAIVAGLSPLAVCAQLVRSASAGALKNFWVSPQPGFVYDSYANLLGPTAMVFILLLAVLLWPPRRHTVSEQNRGRIRWAEPALGRHELAACVVLVAMPLVVYLAALFTPVPFFTRYVQPVTIGFTVILAVFTHRIGGAGVRFQSLLISLLVWSCLLPWTFWQFSKIATLRTPGAYLEQHPKLPLDSGLPIVFDCESDFIEFYHYGTPEVRSRIYSLLNSEAAIRFRGSDTVQRSIALAQTVRELHAVDYHEFLAGHREFLVVRLSEEGWVVQSLLADGAQVQLVSLDKDPGSYVRSASVYHVLIPHRSR
jgi:hypothetical protein